LTGRGPLMTQLRHRVARSGSWFQAYSTHVRTLLSRYDASSRAQGTKMRRRELLVAIATTAAVWSLAVRAQQGERKLRRIGHLIGGTQAVTSRVSVGLIEGLRDLGYVEGRDYIVEYRYAEGHYDRFPVLAAELVRLNVDVVVLGTPAAISAMRRQQVQYRLSWLS